MKKKKKKGAGFWTSWIPTAWNPFTGLRFVFGHDGIADHHPPEFIYTENSLVLFWLCHQAPALFHHETNINGRLLIASRMCSQANAHHLIKRSDLLHRTHEWWHIQSHFRYFRVGPEQVSLSHCVGGWRCGDARHERENIYPTRCKLRLLMRRDLFCTVIIAITRAVIWSSLTSSTCSARSRLNKTQIHVAVYFKQGLKGQLITVDITGLIVRACACVWSSFNTSAHQRMEPAWASPNRRSCCGASKT